MKFLEHRIADRRILRLIAKWLRAGVTEEGKWSQTKVGTPQGSVLSPFLANVYLDYVLALWVHWWQKQQSKGYIVKRKRVTKRLGQAIKDVKATLMHCRHVPVAQQGEWLGRVVLWYFNYHAIPGNLDAPERFRGEVVCGWLHALRRRRERHHMTRACFGKFVDIWLPQPKILPP